ncbi:hypothetical protein Moror_2854 [Moniliophthora roreri MCA 2997]|uniref:Uncharacterized protein n=2 Tax=Moniliophthora roreri TaxID=221103 RepID=V2XC36_MONRO|nr:hypothetical protein Moror_2854 [Moniliophthora roreri MCA 2997]
MPRHLKTHHSFLYSTYLSYAFRIVFGLGASTGILFTARADKGASLKAHRDLPEPSLGILISELGRREMVTGDRLDVIGVSRTMRVKNDENLADPFSRDEPNVKLVNENAISSTLPTVPLCIRDKWHDANVLCRSLTSG